MIGLILLACSWLLLRIEGKNLGELGLNRPKRRLAQFVIAFLATGVVAAIQQLWLAALTGDSWVYSASFSWSQAVEHLRWNINSVLYEELVFRGYLLYMAIRYLGPRRAVWIGASVFGVYHWFSYEIIGILIPMVYVFILTGAFGYMFSLSFARTGTIVAPIGLHLGWNAVSYVVFSGGPLGKALFILESGADRITAEGWLPLIPNLLLPIGLAVFVSWLLIRLYPYRDAPSGESDAV